MKSMTLWLARAAACLAVCTAFDVSAGSLLGQAPALNTSGQQAPSAEEMQASQHGPADATVTIVEFADFTSDPSARLAFMLEAIAKIYPQDVRIVFKHNPDTTRVNALQAHDAALAAAAQGKFWEMSDVLFSNQARLQRDDLVRMAAQVGLDRERFASDLDGRRFADVIVRDRQEAASAGAVSGAACVLNGQRLAWPLTLQKLRDAVDAAIKSNQH
jgi:protein-disulfide isomerase